MSCPTQIAGWFRTDALSQFVALFVVLFSVLTLLYSFGYMRRRGGLVRYYCYLVLTLAASLGAVFANNLILFVSFWGFLGMLLYLLILFNESESASYTAKKAFIIIGGTDAFMLFGLAVLWCMSGSLHMDKIDVGLEGGLAVCAYLCLAAGALAKAGAMPFHTWVPDTAEDAPIPVVAYLPASLDKLLGIYFLARLSLDMFRMTPAMNTLLMAIGSITIVAAVMMALVQHDYRRLLGYHAVSQVGYMVLGIGTGNPIGIAGGLFHMLNNAIYKSCLFFAGGAVEKRAGTSDLGKMGGYATVMPVTFVSALVAALAISGVPPLNGFASKWMVYQGIIDTAGTGHYLWVVWLLAAMFGSALTLASFTKLIHAMFLGQPAAPADEAKTQEGEASPTMWIPMVLLAALCIVFGVFASQVPLKLFITPSVGEGAAPTGAWSAGTATILLLIGLGLGAVIYWLGTVGKARSAEIFVGGERVEEYPALRVSGTEFYQTVRSMCALKTAYAWAEHKVFDAYEVAKKATFGFSAMLGFLHSGALPRYLSWCLVGMLVLFYVLLVRGMP